MSIVLPFWLLAIIVILIVAVVLLLVVRSWGGGTYDTMSYVYNFFIVAVALLLSGCILLGKFVF